MLKAYGVSHWALSAAIWKLEVMFSGGPAGIEQISLRWIHIVSAIVWVGFLFFFLLVVAPTLHSLDPATRAKVFPALAGRIPKKLRGPAYAERALEALEGWVKRETEEE